jgi:hypothetical protein
MTQSVPAFLSEHFICSAHFFLEQTDTGGKLTEEQWRNVKTFEDLDNSLDGVPLELIEQTIQLRARNAEAFENSVSAMCAAVCDTFRPLTAADFLQTVNEDTYLLVLAPYAVVLLDAARSRQDWDDVPE